MSNPISVAQATAPVAGQSTDVDPKWEGVPEVFQKDPSYYKNIDEVDIMLQVEKAKTTMSQHDCKMTSKKNFEVMKAKPDGERRFPLIKVSGPPCRIRWPSLHATGDYGSPWTDGGIPKQTLSNANFGVVFYEGNIPEDLVQKFPAIEREQTLFFDFCERMNKLGVQLMYDHKDPFLRSEGRKATEEFLISVYNGDRTKLELPENQEKLKKQFFDKSNTTSKGKTPLVRQPNEHYKKRWIPMKKSVSGDIDPKKKAKWEKTGIVKNNIKHYIDQLLEANKEYHPPCIINGSGKMLDLKLNEKQVLESNDICVPAFFPKVYDANDYGIRALFCSLQLIRTVRDSETDNTGINYGEMADDYNDDDILNRKRKRQGEDNPTDDKKPKIDTSAAPVLTPAQQEEYARQKSLDDAMNLAQND